MKGRDIPYSAKELRWIEAHSRDHRARTHAAFCKKFKRSDVSLTNFNALCKRKGWMTGRTGRLEKGNVPHNKGKPCPAGKGGRHPNARKTQFRKGQLPHTYRGPGHEMIDPKDGYVYIIVAATNPHTGAATRRVLKHKWLWEQKNGPVPKGHCLKALDGNRLNTDPSNWEAIPRGVAIRLQRGKWDQGFDYDAAPADLKPAIMAIAKIRHATRLKSDVGAEVSIGEENDG